MRTKLLANFAGAAALMLGASAGYAQCYIAPTVAPEIILQTLEAGQFELGAMAAKEDEYLIGDWDGDGIDNVGVRRGNEFLLDTDWEGGHEVLVKWGRGNNEDGYLVGDFTQSGCDTIAVRRDSSILIDLDLDGAHDLTVVFGEGNAADEYYVKDFDGDGIDDIGVRNGNTTVRDLGPAWDGIEDGSMKFGGANEDQYLWGSWCPPCLTDGIPPSPLREQVAVRRGNRILMNDDHDGAHEYEQVYGSGAGEDEYLVGDVDGDTLDNLIVRRGNMLLIDTNYDGSHDILEVYGSGTP